MIENQRKFNHIPYTKLAGNDVQASKYQERVRITSTTESFDEKVYYPETLTGKMEAIVIDTKKDTVLQQFLKKVEVEFLKAIHSGTPIHFNDFMEYLCEKIAVDFPYSNRMTEETYKKTAYVPGKKYQLGKFMADQNMVCRHMGLLVAITIEHLKKSQNTGRYVDQTTQVRFLSDQQTDETSKNRSGHAYALVKKFSRSQQKTVYVIVDPAGKTCTESTEIYDSKIPERIKQRYLFSLMRHLVCDTDETEDQTIIEHMRILGKHQGFLDVLNNLEQVLKKGGHRATARLIKLKTAAHIRSRLEHQPFNLN